MYIIKKISNENINKIRISFCGDRGVGKTCILNSFLGFEYNEEHLDTIGINIIENKFKLNNGKDIKIILWDASGAEKYRSFSLKNIRYSNVCVIVFDVTLKQSFENLSLWIEEIKDKKPNIMIIIFGNKVDKDKSKWEVTNEEINKFIKGQKLKYFEVSAKNNKGIKEGIEFIANELCSEKEYIIIPPRKK